MNITINRKAHKDYEVLETVECGIELKGSEVKSLREGNINLNDSFARVDKGQVFLYNAHVSPYAQASYLNVDPVRSRKLLLHKKQIVKFDSQLSQKSLTLVPLKAYFNSRGFVKIELALCKGKKLYDRRADIKKRETDLDMRRAMRRK